MLPEHLSSLSVQTMAAVLADLASAREWLVAAAALAGIVTGLAFGAFLGAWRLRRALRAPLARLVALAEGDDASPVPGTARRDVAGEVARATERVVSGFAAARGQETTLRAALEEAEARAAAAERQAKDALARAEAAERRAEEAEARAAEAETLAEEARAQSAAAQRRAEEAEARTADAALLAAIATVLAEELSAELEPEAAPVAA